MEITQADITKICSKYFEIIDNYFGSIKRYLTDEEDSHIDLGIKIADYPFVSDLIYDAIDDLDSEIEKFWKENISIMFDFIRNQNSLKCLYSGNITPPILENFVKRNALYIDTVIIPDPIFNLTIFQKQITLNKKYYLNKLIRNVFNIWRLKELILADTKEKILVVIPINYNMVNQKERIHLLINAEDKFKTYINKIFNINLLDKESCLEFLSQQKTTKDIFSNIKNHDLVPNTFKDLNSFDDFLIEFSKTGKYTALNPSRSIGEDFCLYLSSQFVRVQEHKFFCEKLRAEPIYDIELPWFFFTYEMGGVDMDAAIINALQQERFNWIGNKKIPISAFRTLREENRLDYMREILRKGMTDLKARNDKDLLLTSKQLEDNFKDAFSKQNMEIKMLKAEVEKIAKKELPITIFGFLAGFVPYLDNIISITSAGRDIYNLLQNRKKIKSELTVKENDFINLLMKTYE